MSESVIAKVKFSGEVPDNCLVFINKSGEYEAVVEAYNNKEQKEKSTMTVTLGQKEIEELKELVDDCNELIENENEFDNVLFLQKSAAASSMIKKPADLIRQEAEEHAQRLELTEKCSNGLKKWGDKLRALSA